jgi:hypothetical protein
MAGSGPHEPGAHASPPGGTHLGSHTQPEDVATQSVMIVPPTGQTGAMAGTAEPHIDGSQSGGVDGALPHSMAMTQLPPVPGSQTVVVVAGGAHAISGTGRSAQVAGVHPSRYSRVEERGCDGVGAWPETEPPQAATVAVKRPVMSARFFMEAFLSLGRVGRGGQSGAHARAMRRVPGLSENR